MEKNDCASFGKVYNMNIKSFIPKENYDCITFNFVLQRMNEIDVVSILNKFAHFLKPNGHIIIQDTFFN